MLKGAIARRYAEAAFEIGVENQTLDRWLNDLRTIADYLGARQLTFILSEPNIQFERKEQVVRDLLQDKVQKDALGLALLIVERQHVEGVKQVRDEFERLYDNYRGQAHAELTTAAPLDDDLREQVKADLQRVTGKRIILHERVDPTILGGAIARVGDTLIDGSVRRKLSLLRQQILRGGGLGGADDGALPDTGTPPGGAPATDTPSVDGGSMINEMGPRSGGGAHVAPRDGDSSANRQHDARGRNKRDRRRRR
ncbi:MAG TPA: ATP synthase F1 subunit delta [Ktedonobacterales bacterium]|nr:ATP synthase F1 subunit delta [Ktedonobacterales bacterium]